VKSARQLLLREVLADSAECFWRHAEVRRDHPLRHLERNSWVRPQKVQVTLLSRQTQRVHDSPVFSSGVLLKRHTEHRRKGGNAFNHPLVRRLVEQEEVGGPNRVDEALARRSSRKKRAISGSNTAMASRRPASPRDPEPESSVRRWLATGNDIAANTE
jgi:hypothetical protein